MNNNKIKHSFVLTGFAFMLSTSLFDNHAHAADDNTKPISSSANTNQIESENQTSSDDNSISQQPQSNENEVNPLATSENEQSDSNSINDLNSETAILTQTVTRTQLAILT